MFQGHDIFNVK